MRSTFIRSSLYVAGILAPWLAAGADTPSDVFDLTPDTFSQFVAEDGLHLVEFFAPWCGHCKALAPHYEEAATALKGKDIKLAKVDCVDQADLCQQNGIQGYPTLKVFKNGNETPYTGPRKADGIISYMVKQSLPAVSTVTTENHEEFKKADKVVAIAYVSSSTDAPAPAFSNAAEAHRDDFLFGLSTDEAAIKAAGVTPPAIVVYKSFDEGRNDYPAAEVSEATAGSIASFVREKSVPLFDEVSGENYGTYAQTGLPLAYLFVDPEDTAQRVDLVESLKPIAKQHKGKLNFVWIDGVKFVEHGKSLALEPNWPALVIQDIQGNLKYPLPQTAGVALSEKTVRAFVDDYAAGKIEPTLKSQAVPEEQTEAYYTLVGSEFEDVLYDDSKDVFVQFSAPWCGHCKRLLPTWEQLANEYKPLSDKIVIAKMDATENDVPPSAQFTVASFPTIKFKPAGTRDFIDYEGDRSLDDLVAFVSRHAKNTLDLEAVKKLASSETGSAGIPRETPVSHEEL